MSEDPNKIVDNSEAKEEHKAPVETTVQDIPKMVNTPAPSRGGFMNGGIPSTFLFLMAFFLVSYYLGVVTERNNKLVNGGSVTGTAQQQQNSASAFGVPGFKKLAQDLKLDTKKFDTCLDSGKYTDAVKKEQDEGLAIQVNGTPSFVINGRAIVGAQPLSVFEDAINNNKFPTDPTASQSAGLHDGDSVTQAITASEKGRIKGNPDAKTTIYEFSDFQCPFCGRFYTDSYKTIVDKYINTGKAKLIYKDFPLSIHPFAQKAAEAARCAQEQGKFWEMHDKLFELQVSSS